MKYLKVVCSNTAPNVRDALWLKPTDGGFTLYALNGGWKPVKMEEGDDEPKAEYEVAGAAEAVKTAVIGSVKDKKTANTINGAKAYAKDAADAVKSYVDEKLAKLD